MQVKTDLEIEFDENSEDFKNLFENYNKDIESCDITGFLEIVANEIVSKGCYEPIEGIGLCMVDGERHDGLKHPININTLGNTRLSGHFDFETYPIYD